MSFRKMLNLFGRGHMDVSFAEEGTRRSQMRTYCELASHDRDTWFYGTSKPHSNWLPSRCASSPALPNTPTVSPAAMAKECHVQRRLGWIGWRPDQVVTPQRPPCAIHLSSATFPILSRDPNLFRKPSKPQEKQPIFQKERWLKRMEKESPPGISALLPQV